MPWLSREEVERRVDMREREINLAPEAEPETRPELRVQPALDGAPGLAIGETFEPTVVNASRVRPVRPVVNRRRILWRDSATILVVVVSALLGAQAFLPHGGNGPTGSSIPTGINLGSLPPGVTLAPGQTLGSLVDPSLGIDATPTPIPVITLGPSPSPEPPAGPGHTHSPTPRPTAKPSANPTPSPTAVPTPTPTPRPTPTPTLPPTPPPPASPAFTCMELPGLQLSCTDLSTGTIASWIWNWGDGEADGGANPPTHTYSTDLSPVTVRLTVSGPGGGGYTEHEYTLVP